MQRRLIISSPRVRHAAIPANALCYHGSAVIGSDRRQPLRDALLRIMDDAWSRERRLIEALPEDEYARRGAPDGWSARDVVAHIAAWRRQAAVQLNHTDNIEREHFDTQTFNERTFREHQDLSWTAIGRIAESAYLVLRAQTERLSDEQLRQPADLSRSNWSPWQLIKVDGFDHPMAHMASLCRRLGDGAKEESIAAAVARTSREVAQLVDFA